jgi:uncharacterized surface protein with fasciclin (FAS1) repeats
MLQTNKTIYMKMSFLKYTLLLLITASFIGCKKDNAASTAPTLDAFIQSNPNLSTFQKALNKANLESFKNGAGPFTWFAPTNDAFTAAGISDDSLNRMTPGQVSYLLQYHIVNAGLNAESMIAVNSAPRSTQLGPGVGQIYIGTVNGESYVNGTKITSRENQVTNGQVHIINRVNTPPVLRGNVVAILSKITGPDTLFVQALRRANLLTALNSSAVFTIFAPTDAAMRAAWIYGCFHSCSQCCHPSLQL